MKWVSVTVSDMGIASQANEANYATHFGDVLRK